MEPRRPRSLDRSGSRSRGALTYEQDEPVDISNRSFDSRRGTNTNKAGTIPHDDLIDEQPTQLLNSKMGPEGSQIALEPDLGANKSIAQKLKSGASESLGGVIQDKIQRKVQQNMRQKWRQIQSSKAWKQRKEQDKIGASDAAELARCCTSEEYLDLVSHQIPVGELYSLLDTCNYNQENDYCPVLVKIQNKELQNSFQGRYLLQVWTREGKLVFQKILQHRICAWNIFGNHLVFVLSEREYNNERLYQHVFIVKLSKTMETCRVAIVKSSLFTFYKHQMGDPSTHRRVEFFKFLGFCFDNLILANDKNVVHIPVPSSEFVENETDLTYQEVPFEECYEPDPREMRQVNLASGVQIKDLFVVQYGRPCLVVETQDTQIMFLKFEISRQNKVTFFELNELVKSPQRVIDKVKKIKSIVFFDKGLQEYKHVAIALRKSGSLDFYWNFRLVDEYIITNPVVQGYFTDVDVDFRSIYFTKIYYKVKTEGGSSKDMTAKDLQRLSAYKTEYKKKKRQSQVAAEKQSSDDESDGGMQIQELAWLDELIERQRAEPIIINEKAFMSKIIKPKKKHVLYQCANSWKERIGINCSTQKKCKADTIEQLWNTSLSQKVTSYVQLYPWFASFQNVFVVTHSRFMSVFDINQQMWKHIELESFVITGFRLDLEKGLGCAQMACLLLDTNEVYLFNPLEVQNEEDEVVHQPPTDLGGQVLRYSHDPVAKRAFFMLVLDYAEDDDEKVGDTLPSINSKRRSKKNLSSKQELSLVVFVAGDTEPHRYDEISEALQTNSTINVLPNTNENKIYFLIDTVIDEKSIQNVYILDISDKGRPELQTTQWSQNNINRPIREDSDKNNSLTGVIEKCAEDTLTKIFVTPKYLDVAISLEKTNDMGETHQYMECGVRNIRAMLQIDSWMYTLSDNFEKSNKVQTARRQQNSSRALDRSHSKKSPGLMNEKRKLKPSLSQSINISQEAEEGSTEDEDEEKEANGPNSSMSAQQEESAGLYVYDLQRLAGSQQVIYYKLKDAIVGVNNHIDFCKRAQRISFLKDFSHLEMVPIPHRNSINFLGMQPKSEYLIWRELNGTFTALDRKGRLKAWVIGTGKTAKPSITVSNIDIQGYELYQNDVDDFTYTREWQLHPEKSISLLKAKKKLNFYPQEEESVLAENQEAVYKNYSADAGCNYYNFKVLTMSNELVKEEYSFTFNVVNTPDSAATSTTNLLREKLLSGDRTYKTRKLQRLYISRDLTKLMEVLDDSRCRIYGFKSSSDKAKEVQVQLLQTIKKYPTPLQGLTSANFLFSPNFNLYFDMDSQKQQFIIKDCATSRTAFRIPRGLYGFKATESSRFSIQELAKHLMFIEEDQIRLINKYGLDTIMQLTHDEHGESIVKIKSIAMIDHYDEMNKRDKHLILDQWPFPPQDTFNRLIRMGQKFKVSMYHTKAQLQELEAKALAQQKQEKQAGKAAQAKPMYTEQIDSRYYFDNKDNSKKSKKKHGTGRNLKDEFEDKFQMFGHRDTEALFKKKLHEQLMTVDYSQDPNKSDSFFVAELTFTILDWQISERILTQSSFNFCDIDYKRQLQLSFNIFPQVKTLLHLIAQSKTLNTQEIQTLFDTASEHEVAPNVPCTIPFLQDCEGRTPLDIALLNSEAADSNLGNCLMKNIGSYPYMHSGVILDTAVIRAFKYKVPGLGEFLDNRLVVSEHLAGGKLNRKALKKEKRRTVNGFNYGVMEADPWQDKNVLNLELFSEDDFERSIVMLYFDIPNLHNSSKQGFDFFNLLSTTSDIDLFSKSAVQIIIAHRWYYVRQQIMWLQFMPYMLFLINYYIYFNYVRPFRSELWSWNIFFCIMLYFFVIYFGMIEVLQILFDHKTYLKRIIWNLSDLLPLFTIFVSITQALLNRDKRIQDEQGITLTLFTFGGFLMWLKVMFYLRLWDSTSYLVRMIQEVIRDMKVFWIILCLFTLAFSDVFFALSLALKEDDRRIHYYYEALIYVFLMINGDFDTSFFVKNTFSCYLFFLACAIINLIVMLNLLVAIISNTYVNVSGLKSEYAFQEKSAAIADIQTILPIKTNHALFDIIRDKVKKFRNQKDLRNQRPFDSENPLEEQVDEEFLQEKNTFAKQLEDLNIQKSSQTNFLLIAKEIDRIQSVEDPGESMHEVQIAKRQEYFEEIKKNLTNLKSALYDMQYNLSNQNSVNHTASFKTK